MSERSAAKHVIIIFPHSISPFCIGPHRNTSWLTAQNSRRVCVADRLRVFRGGQRRDPNRYALTSSPNARHKMAAKGKTRVTPMHTSQLTGPKLAL